MLFRSFGATLGLVGELPGDEGARSSANGGILGPENRKVCFIYLKPADPPFLGTNANSYSVSGSPAIVKQCMEG